jgi:hypothetical protein
MGALINNNLQLVPNSYVIVIYSHAYFIDNVQKFVHRIND